LPQLDPRTLEVGTDVSPKLTPKSVTLNWSPELKPSTMVNVPLIGSVNVQAGSGAAILSGLTPGVALTPLLKLEPNGPNVKWYHWFSAIGEPAPAAAVVGAVELFKPFMGAAYVAEFVPMANTAASISNTPFREVTTLGRLIGFVFLGQGATDQTTKQILKVNFCLGKISKAIYLDYSSSKFQVQSFKCEHSTA